MILVEIFSWAQDEICTCDTEMTNWSLVRHCYRIKGCNDFLFPRYYGVLEGVSDTACTTTFVLVVSHAILLIVLSLGESHEKKPENMFIFHVSSPLLPRFNIACDKSHGLNVSKMIFMCHIIMNVKLLDSFYCITLLWARYPLNIIGVPFTSLHIKRVYTN